MQAFQSTNLPIPHPQIWDSPLLSFLMSCYWSKPISSRPSYSLVHSLKVKKKRWSVTGMEIRVIDVSESSLVWNQQHLFFGFLCATFPQSPTLTRHVTMACLSKQMEVAKEWGMLGIAIPQLEGGKKTRTHIANWHSPSLPVFPTLPCLPLEPDNFWLLPARIASSIRLLQVSEGRTISYKSTQVFTLFGTRFSHYYFRSFILPQWFYLMSALQLASG